SSKTVGDKISVKSRKNKNEELEKIAEKFRSLIQRKQSSYRREQKNNSQEESLLRANRLKFLVNELKATVQDPKDPSTSKGDSAGHYANVAEAIKKTFIFSVVDKLVSVEKTM
ncbi:11207_t:CDS:2, partial [Gigaspora rosea]